jgi:hypothetical protein
MMRRLLQRRMLTAAILLLAGGGSALADRIDGDWCRADGKRMSIHGPDIVTPGGKQIQGDYTRHSSLTWCRPARRAQAKPSLSPCCRNISHMGAKALPTRRYRSGTAASLE